MDTIKYQEGDLFDALPSAGSVVIPHIVNSVGAWGAGFVVPLGNKFPVARRTYYDWFREQKWPTEKKDFFNFDLNPHQSVPFELGSTIIPRVSFTTNTIYVAHMLAQDGLPNFTSSRPLRYDALEKCLKLVGKFANKRGFSIYCPLFGAGIAGGEWPIIEAMVQKYWVKRCIPVTCFYLKDKLPRGWNPPNPS